MLIEARSREGRTQGPQGAKINPSGFAFRRLRRLKQLMERSSWTASFVMEGLATGRFRLWRVRVRVLCVSLRSCCWREAWPRSGTVQPNIPVPAA